MSSLAINIATGCLLLVTSVLCLPYDLGNRILDGYETTIEQFPYQLAIEGGKRHICGASVLTKDWALTAAHCVYQQPAKWLTIRSGSSERQRGGTLHPVESYITHELYDKRTMDYDVAVVKVGTPFQFKEGTLPVVLPFHVPVEGESVSVAGWGFLEKEQLRKPRQLMVMDVYTLGWEQCKKIYPDYATPRMLCAGDGFRDTCGGDSGGPLVRGSREQVGIVSWGYKCGDGLPSVYTNVTSVVPWIRAQIGEDDYIVFPD